MTLTGNLSNSTTQEDIARTKAAIKGKQYLVYCGNCMHLMKSAMGDECAANPTARSTYLKEIVIYHQATNKNTNNDCEDYEQYIEPSKVRILKPWTWWK